MALASDDQQIIERLRKSLYATKRALDANQFEAALGGVERLLLNNLEPIATAFSSVGAPQMQGSEELVQAIEEKWALKKELAEAKNAMVKTTGEVARLKSDVERLSKLKDAPTIIVADPWLIRVLVYVMSCATITWPPQPLDLDACKASLDAILAPYILVAPPPLATIMASENVLREIPFLSADLTWHYERCELPHAVFADCAAVFPKRDRTRIMVCLLNNVPFESDMNVSALRALAQTVRKYLGGTTPIRPWIAYSVRCGILQQHLHRLENVEVPNDG